MQKPAYQNTNKGDSRKIAEFLSKDGQLLLSAEQLAGLKQPGKSHGAITWHGRQQGVVSLSERKLRIEKPRLRRKGRGVGKEVSIPA